ncbi:hypothetical protein [Streptomyces sp. NBC_01481]|uniref:hypothetical protein n=1 Tax=Streptomyces sp. NBC_01481 TaxID=2975869 RepID=UPI00224E0E95|nr:hypothetical protein [Streptomyces sp. NBC_01481]MCX4584066.1 hypothetical protein [Streptomyces sp. NBC_01481]
MALTLFAFAYAHVTAEGTTGHLGASATVTAAAALHDHAVQEPPVDHHDGHHGPSHTAQDCVPGQPQQTPVLDAPGACALADEGAPPAPRPALVAFGDVASARQLPSTPIRATVLQI